MSGCGLDQSSSEKVFFLCVCRLFYDVMSLSELIPVAARSKAWVCGRSLDGILGSPARDMDVCCECCVLSGRGLCDGPITRPEESYRLWCV